MADVDKLKEMLGFDPSVELSVPAGVLGEAIKEIQEERKAKVMVKAKEQLVKAIELQGKMKQVKKEFDSQTKKFEKEFGKVMRGLEAMAKGEELPEEEKKDEPCECKCEDK